MFKFLKSLFAKSSRNPIAKLQNTEIEVTVKRADGTLKSYRKVVNNKQTENVDY